MSGVSFRVELDDIDAQASFARLIAAGRNLRPLMTEIGTIVEDSTRGRFETERAPDGTPWLPISDEWREYKEAKGHMVGILKMRGDLANSPRFETGADYVELIVGPTEYAAIHNFGGQAGRGRKTTLPARTFAGLSAEDRQDIDDAAADYLDLALKGLR